MSHRATKICTFWWAFSRHNLRENVYEKPLRIVELGRWVVGQDFPFHLPVNFTQTLHGILRFSLAPFTE